MNRIPRRLYTAEFKREAIKLVTEQGLTFSEAGKKLDVATKSLRTWMAQCERGELKASLGASRLTAEQQRICELERELAITQMERDILKKATAYDGRDAGARATQERLPPSRGTPCEGRVHSTTSGALSGGAAVRGAAGYAGWLLRLVQTPSIQT